MTAAMLVLEPIFEADLPGEQFAYRLGRNVIWKSYLLIVLIFDIEQAAWPIVKAKLCPSPNLKQSLKWTKGGRKIINRF